MITVWVVLWLVFRLEIGTLVTVGTGMATLFVALLSLSAAPQETPAVRDDVVQEAKKALLRAVKRQWEEEARIRALEDPEPITVLWKLVADQDLVDLRGTIRKVSHDFAVTGDTHLASRFGDLHRRRLVIIGDHGTGKTTLAIQLLLQLLEAGDALERPVPVLIPVNAWDTVKFPDLHAWLTARLLRHYPVLASPGFGRGTVTEVIERGHVMPVLDGLDEMPREFRAAVVSALNKWLSGTGQYVLTSRRDEFAAAVQAQGLLTAAAVIAPSPIAPAAAARYLRTCLPPEPRHDWELVWTALNNRTHPGLSELCATAFGLWLIRTVYVKPLNPPCPWPLIAPHSGSGPELRAHLLDHIVTAVIQDRAPDRNPDGHFFLPRRSWDPADARRYLGHLARAMHEHKTYDLAWWELARTTGPYADRHRVNRPAATLGLVLGLTLGLVHGFAAPLEIGLVSGRQDWLTIQLSSWIVIDLLTGIMFALVFGLKFDTWSREAPGAPGLRLRDGVRVFSRTGTAARRWFTFGLAGGAVTGLVGVLAVTVGSGRQAGVVIGTALGTGLVLGLVSGVLLGAVAGMARGIIEWLESPMSTKIVSSPRAALRADATLNASRWLALGLLAGLVTWLLGALIAMHPALRLALAVHGALLYGMPAALIWGQHHAWIAYLLSVHRLARQGKAPRRLMAFLEDAHRLGLLRTAGPVYQFRHADIQDHLALPPPQDQVVTSGRPSPRDAEPSADHTLRTFDE
ncbi:NACHT domain-containing protein [Sphaerisporangium rubeum]|uniref:NACHT domain-containing protein n=1 Tax=Sphaerisporangium rubeum TaxID=321317 RepID=A0A7X0IEV5_9ACTN|nr:hypothetical protein [Sphaerisporangium rubeum]MBB6473755.1 hypothetical protein [Sphaerisporangium rubeum]